MSGTRTRAGLFLALLSSCAADLELGTGRFACGVDGECPAGASCIEGFCEVSAADDPPVVVGGAGSGSKQDVGAGGFVSIPRHPAASAGDVQIIHIISETGDTSEEIRERETSDWTLIQDTFDSGAFHAGLWYRVIADDDPESWEFSFVVDDDVAFVSVAVSPASADTPVFFQGPSIRSEPATTVESSIVTTAEDSLLLLFYGAASDVAASAEIDDGTELIDVQHGSGLIHQAVYSSPAPEQTTYSRTVTSSVEQRCHALLVSINPP